MEGVKTGFTGNSISLHRLARALTDVLRVAYGVQYVYGDPDRRGRPMCAGTFYTLFCCTTREKYPTHPRTLDTGPS